jgi:predicted nuclease of predicted toxin-antitoxin system
VRFIVDANLPPALARFLESEGHQAQHVDDVGLRAAKDTSIWNYALAQQAIIISKDEDFEDRISRGAIPAPQLIWIRLGNTTKRALLLWFKNVLGELIKRIEAGEQIIEIV